MKRTVISAFLAIAALAMLAALVLRSRSLPLDVHIAQNTIGTTLQRAGEDFGTLVSTLQSAWTKGQSPGDGARALGSRLEQSPDTLRSLVTEMPGSVTQKNLLRSSFNGFSQTVVSATTLASDIFENQTTYVASVTFVRDEGPKVIQQMRDLKLDKDAANAFQLVIGTLDFSTPNATVREAELRQLLVGLQQEADKDSSLLSQAGPLAEAVQNILDNKRNLVNQLTQLASMPVVSQASNLRYATEALYRSAVASHEQARAMLSIYAVALLIVIGFIAFRLQGSYREVNQANGELADLNSSLEQRVAMRTKELGGALRNLQESQVQLVQAEKMSSLGQLVAGISHEINTPLLYLSNNAELIQERVLLVEKFVERCAKAFSLRPDEFEDRAQYQQQLAESLKGIKRQLRQDELQANTQEACDLAQDSIEGLGDLREMAQSLKDFSRLDRAPVASFDVRSGLDKTLVIARNIVKQKAEVRKFYSDDLPDIQCSPSQINQVFLNLITNAAQAIPNYGEIVLTTKRHGTNHVAVSIADTGSGIPQEIISKIRDPFFTTKEVGTGTGLGLSIVDEIIRSHGGELQIKSEVGKGSVFTVILPIKHQDHSSDTAPENADREPVPEDRQQEEEVAFAEAS